MNADGSDQHLVSTGKGATTCGYFLVNGKHIIYASTHQGIAHEEHPNCPQKPDRARGYHWPVYADYHLKACTRLARANAGDWIVVNSLSIIISNV